MNYVIAGFLGTLITLMVMFNSMLSVKSGHLVSLIVLHLVGICAATLILLYIRKPKQTKKAQEINKYVRLYGLSKMLDEGLINALKLYYFEPGDYIVRAGEYPTHLYFYVQGKSKVFQLLENGKSLLF